MRHASRAALVASALLALAAPATSSAAACGSACYEYIRASDQHVLQLLPDGLYDVTSGGTKLSDAAYAELRAILARGALGIGATTNTPPPLPPGASDPVPQIKVLAGTSEARRTVLSRIAAIAERLKVLPAANAIGTVGAAASEFEVGWRIGTKFRRLGFPGRGELTGTSQNGWRATAVRYQGVSAGAISAGCGDAWGQSSCTAYPSDGFHYQFQQNDIYEMWRDFVSADEGGPYSWCPTTPATFPCPWTVLPAGFVTLTLVNEAYGYTVQDRFLPASAVATTALEDYANQPYGKSSPAPANPTEAELDAGTDAAIADDANRPAIEWTLAVSGWPQVDGVPATPVDPTTLLVPDCRGLGYGACTGELAAAGFTGTLTRAYADLDAAEPELPAETVLRTSPAAGAHVADDSAFTVTTNPETPDMPITVPDCSGLTYDPCVQAFRDGGATGAFTREFTSFDDADVTKPAAAVLSMSVTPGTRMRTADDVTITTNPLDADMPRVVPAPANAPGETPEAYIARLPDGLTATWQETTTPDYEYGAGNVVAIDVPAATRVPKGTTLHLRTEPQDPCDRYPRGDPGNGPTNMWYVVAQYGGDPLLGSPTVVDPTTGNLRLVKLHWGIQSWGLRHIWLGHGWGPLDDADTGAAILTDKTPLPDPRNPDMGRLFYYMYLQGTQECTRRVLVDFQKRPDDYEPRDVITSYAYPGWEKH